MSTIVVLVPVLNRPGNAQKLVDSLAASEADAEIVFLCTVNDTDEIAACQATGARTEIVPWRPTRGDWAKKINWGHKHTDEPYLLLGADDLHFHPRWDEYALRAARTTGAGVVGTNDLGNRWVMKGQLATHALVDRVYADESGTIDEPGKILHEGYFHNWVDAELTETAVARGKFAFARQSHVEHLHPSWGKAEIDATYTRGLDQSQFERDRNLLHKRRPLWRVVAQQRRQSPRMRRQR